MEGQKNVKLEVIKRFVEQKDEEDLNKCLSTLMEKSTPIGLGGNAEVFELSDPHFGEICVKKIHKTPQLRCNSEEEEFAFQEEIEDLGVRVPRLIAYVQNPETKDKFIIMEKILGPSFNDILEKGVSIPENYNHAFFWKKLMEYLKIMHDGNIYHRDLHRGNIMIDKDGGPVIIDFGTAGRAWGSEDDPYKESVPMLDKETGTYRLSYQFQKDEGKASWTKDEIAKKLA